MSKLVKRPLLGLLCSALIAGACATPALAAPPEPDFVFLASQNRSPGGDFEGPCGLAVDNAGNFYVSDYYRHAIDVFNSSHGYITQIANVDPLDGPCGLAVDPTGKNIYVNNFHRNVTKYTASAIPPSPSTAFTLGPLFESAAHPTGVAVDTLTGNFYVNDRTYITGYDSTGVQLLDGRSDPLRIGVGTLRDGYGLAYSNGLLYVSDAATRTVKTYNSNPALNIVTPVLEFDGRSTPNRVFVSLIDSAVAVDGVSGDIYVADNLEPQFNEQPEAAIYVFDSAGAYKGRLKYNIHDALPPGLAVDNSVGLNQGRVYVTSGNTTQASVYAYPRGSATNLVFPPKTSLAVMASGTGSGSVTSSVGGLDCSTACEAGIRSGAQVSLTATPDEGSAFVGWSGDDCSGTGSCELTMSETATVNAQFSALPSFDVPPAQGAPAPAAAPATQATGRAHARRRHRAKHRRRHGVRHNQSMGSRKGKGKRR